MNQEIDHVNAPTHSDLHGQVCTGEKVTHVLMTDGRLFRRVIDPPSPPPVPCQSGLALRSSTW